MLSSTSWLRRGRAARVLAAVAAVLLAGITTSTTTVVVVVVHASSQAHSQNPYVCNGSPRFCDLKYNQYTFASTSGSLSYGLVGDCFPFEQLGVPEICQPFYAQNRNILQEQGGRDIIRQLKDGIREFEINACSFASYAVTCSIIPSGSGGPEAVARGQDIDRPLQQIAEYMKANVGEVVTLELSDIRNATTTVPYIIDRIALRFPNRILNRPTKAWPTLGQMVRYNRRLVVFVSDDVYAALGTRPAWVFKASSFYMPSSVYLDPALGPYEGGQSVTALRADAAQALSVIQGYCDHPVGTELKNRWQCLDFIYAAQISLGYNHWAVYINQYAAQVAFHCLIKTFVHRIRVQWYFFGVEMRYLAYKINLARWLMLKRNLVPENLV